MKRVVFHGPLRKFSKTDYLVNASSWREINESMQANLPNYLNLRKKLMADIGHIYFLIDGEPLRDIDNLDNAIKRAEKIDLIPVVAQQGFGAVFAFIGKLILTFAISFAISYFLTKLLTPKDPKQVKTSSYVINPKTNTASRNDPVPIAYGRLRVAPNVISVLGINRDIPQQS